SPGIGDSAGTRAMRDLGPEFAAARLEPVVKSLQRGEGRQRLPEPVAGVLNVLLDLSLLPSGRRIAELGLEQEVADHGREASVDLTLLAASNLVDRGAHIIVDAALRHAAQDAEVVIVGVKQHLVCLLQIGTNDEGAAVGELE